jgi:hypothetical protein
VGGNGSLFASRVFWTLSTAAAVKMELHDIRQTVQDPLKEVLPPDLKPTQAIDRVADPQMLCRLFRSAEIFPKVSYVHDVIIDVVASFTARHRALLEHYLARRAALNTVCLEVIRYIARRNMSFDSDLALQALESVDAALDAAVKVALEPKLSARKLSLCGFGLGSGEYELKLTNDLNTQGLAPQLDLYGFDPYPRFDSSKILSLTSEDLCAAGGPRFDIILSRWVLHHVHQENRWKEFIACVNRSKSDAKILVIEEGTFTPKTQKSTPLLFYEYLIGCADVVVNSILCPSWLFPPTGKPGEQFYLEYLTCDDVTSLEWAFKTPVIRDVRWISAGFFPQILIIWTVRNSSNSN